VAITSELDCALTETAAVKGIVVLSMRAERTNERIFSRTGLQGVMRRPWEIMNNPLFSENKNMKEGLKVFAAYVSVDNNSQTGQDDLFAFYV
jgi:hypothetical protein